ncbi:facilitated trehalose transporter Tret1-like [Periplaneta americana]|uniref:facilitated trehalose transporter Tret1-like n=1 Tax=Periplaneta americana TaxID=6978 RepID=UPI0037E72CDE
MGEITISTDEILKNDESGTQSRRVPKASLFVAGITAGISSFTYGNVVGWMSPTLPLLQSTEPAVGETAITPDQASWLGSLLFLGALVASPIFGYICENYGRKAGGYISSIPLLLSWILIIFGNNFTYLYIARFLAGLSVGGIIVFFPMYCSEIAEDSNRGILGSFLALFCNTGTLVTYVIGPFVSYTLLGSLSLLVPLIFIFGFYWLPETPVFLVSKGRIKEAENSLLWLRGRNEDIVAEELSNIHDLITSQTTSQSKRKVLQNLWTRRNSKAFLISIILCVCNQCTGIFVVLNYCIEILEMSGSSLSPSIASMYAAAVQLVGSLLASSFIDHLGRKTLLIAGQILVIICMGALGTYFHLQQLGEDLDNVSFIPVSCLSVYLAAVSMGLAPVTFVIICEVFHPDFRGIIMMMATSLIWALAFIITKIYPFFVDHIGLHGCFWGFSVVSAVCLLFTVFMIPETKNRSLESILRELHGEKIQFYSQTNENNKTQL